MSELGLTPAARTRLPNAGPSGDAGTGIHFLTVVMGEDGDWEERPLDLGHRDLKAV